MKAKIFLILFILSKTIFSQPLPTPGLNGNPQPPLPPQISPIGDGIYILMVLCSFYLILHFYNIKFKKVKKIILSNLRQVSYF
jgi:hypothetical protein